MGSDRGVLRTLMGGPYRRALPYFVIGLLLLGTLAVSAWVVRADLAHRKGEEKGEESERNAVETGLAVGLTSHVGFPLL